MSDLDLLVNEARTNIARCLEVCCRPLIAYSGGKDSIVTAHLCTEFGLREAVCEASFIFQRQEESQRRIADALGLNVTYTYTIDRAWLDRYPHVIFSYDNKVWSWVYARRQQAAVTKRVKEGGYDGAIFGRRKQTNCVPSALYRRADGCWQCHPLANWKTDHVWEYLHTRGIEVPWIYSTEFGQREGNAPFFLATPKRFPGDADYLWRLVESMDPRYAKANFVKV